MVFGVPECDDCTVWAPVRGDLRENSVSVKFESSEIPEALVDNGLSLWQQNTLDADLNTRSWLKCKEGWGIS